MVIEPKKECVEIIKELINFQSHTSMLIPIPKENFDVTHYAKVFSIMNLHLVYHLLYFIDGDEGKNAL